mmetsp:Transcript_9645/g.9604  ORF Transcript_9645/g.9604 Transcript_9645/m.9604 type:complete len:191 (+) Transcript_9645:310-882(+)
MLKEKEKIKTEIIGKNEIISRLEIQMKNNEKTYVQRLENFEKKIEEENQREKTVQNVIESLKNALIESQNSEEQMKKKKEIKEEEIKVHIEEIREMRETEEKFLNNIDEINKNLRNTIPAIKIKSIACLKCYEELKETFKEKYMEALRNEGRESLLTSFILKASVKPTEGTKRARMESITRETCKQCILM